MDLIAFILIIDTVILAYLAYQITPKDKRK